MSEQTAHRDLGLTDHEYELIVDKMGRAPNATELAMFSLMWSEHCGYKHSKKLLGQLPTEGPHVLMGPGENAGAVDVGDGLAIAFKVESHNHPSAVDPFEGAATGVGGVARDILAVGARPIAALDSMRFGELSSARSRQLTEGAIAGIAHYGSGLGVATIGGELYFEDPYEQNCLVNAMALGLVPGDRMMRSAAAGIGNHVLMFGAETGREGIGGASVLASAELEADGEDATTEVVGVTGDPELEARLIECTLELLGRGLITSMQDLGAAGLTSASSEMASGGGVGLTIHVDRVPVRESGMEPFEIMVSESQERMLCIVAPEQLAAVEEACAKWDLIHAVIGEVTDTQHMQIFENDELVGDIPVAALVDECPLYDLSPERPTAQIYPAPRVEGAAGEAARAAAEDADATLRALLASDNIASRAALYGRFDSGAGAGTLYGPGEAEAAVVQLPREGEEPAAATGPTIAVSVDGSGRKVGADPYRGTIGAVLECAANIACVGGEPFGLTNGLNFGNPEKPHIAWQLSESVRGLADACRALDLPVVSGNVSLYNESAEGPIYPTPIVGIVGGIPDPARVAGNKFTEADLFVALVGPFAPDLGASELAKLCGEPLPEELPEIDLPRQGEALRLVREGVRSGVIKSARDISEGGLATALAECCLGGVGAEIDAAPLIELVRRRHTHESEDQHARSALFGESPGGIVISGQRDDLLEFSRRAANVGFLALGTTGGDRLTVGGPTGRLGAISLPVSELQSIHGSAVESRLASAE